MSSFDTIRWKCGNCGAKLTTEVMLSTNNLGGYDLDFRPEGVSRYTMSYWIYQCPTCGYVNSNLSEKPDFPPAYLQSEAYLACDGISFSHELAPRFYRRALLSLQANNLESAYMCFLYVAWCCDDNKDKKMQSFAEEKPLLFMTSSLIR